MLAQDWKSRAVDADGVMSHIQSHHKVFVHGAAATPTPLLQALCRRTDLEGVDLYHLHLTGDCPVVAPEQNKRLISNSLFTGAPMRKPIEEARADFIPVFLSDIPRLFKSKRIPLDVAVVQLSPPDRHGLCTLGPSVDTALAAVENARIVLAEINDRMPRTIGHTAVHFERVTAFMLSSRPLIEAPAGPESEVEGRIGDIIADLVHDGSTLQMGIGAIPDAVLTRLKKKNDLGVHTEMFSDRVIDLMESGVVNNRYKRIHQGRTVTSFVAGTQRLFDFIDDNRSVEFHPCDRTNDTALIRQNPRVVAVNSALEVDLTGQVCADSIGHKIYSGIGGQMDFIHGAALSEGGLPIIALPSTAAGGKVSRITPTLKPGAGVVTTRGHVHWVVTEFGAVDLYGCTLRQRAELLISIAHPDFRADLRKQMVDLRHYVMG